MASESEKVPNASGGKPQEGGEGSEDLTQFVSEVEKLLGDMHQKFQQMSDQIIGRLDEMGKRVEDLEKNINELMQQIETREETSAKK